MKRYELVSDESGKYMAEDADGEYVRYAEVHPLVDGDLATQRAICDGLPGPNGEGDAGALAIEYVEQQPCPRWPDATALKCAKKGKEYPRCRFCDAARAIDRERIPATGIPQEKT